MPLHTLAINGPEDVLARVRGHYLAVSTTLYCEFRGSTAAAQRAAAFIFTRQPVARTTTYLIYDFTKD